MPRQTPTRASRAKATASSTEASGGSAANTMDGAWEAHGTAPPVVRRIDLADLRQALREGARDFGACRTDVVFLCMIYPIAGLIISRFAFDYGMLPLIFPLVSGFALIAPLFGVGLYEMSRRRELGSATGWADAFAVVRSPAIGSIMALGLILIGLFTLWLAAANLIYTVTLGPDSPVSAIAFARDAVTTPQGWTRVIAGIGTDSSEAGTWSWSWRRSPMRIFRISR